MDSWLTPDKNHLVLEAEGAQQASESFLLALIRASLMHFLKKSLIFSEIKEYFYYE